MPRTARASVGDICDHVINRGNAQSEVFHKAGDYQIFVELLGLACDRIPMRVLAYSARFAVSSVGEIRSSVAI